MSCILLVEDDVVVRKVMELALIRALKDCRVLSATTGLQFLELVKSRQPDLILLDVQLPDANGISLYHIIRDDHRLAHVPVLFVTTTPEVVRHAALTGDYLCLAKPFEVADLIKLVPMLLGPGSAAARASA
jgi:chemosensory pili system protein ChpA (sensor histidine kinase/response regulator)